MNVGKIPESKPVGLYIHVPFCITKCNYCSFYSLEYDKITANLYKSAIVRNVQNYIKSEQVCFDSVFFGGGTPSLLWHDIVDIVGALPLTRNAEVTIEANPCDIVSLHESEGLPTGGDCGLNRVSIGVQSLDDAVLQKLGRRHNAAQAVKAAELSKRAGFNNISVDIMLGIAGQSAKSLSETIERLTALPINHVSAYMYEQNHGSVASLGDDESAEMYLQAVEVLARKGFMQYEISNFALPGFECRHNLKYWNCEEYIGIGAAAHSRYGNMRYAVPQDVESFVSASLQEVYVTEENPGGFEERVMLGLRLSAGVDLASFTEAERKKLLQRADLIPQEYIKISENNISLTARGFLVANSIIVALVQ